MYKGNGKKSSFRTDFGTLGPNLGCYFFFKIWLHHLLDVIVSNHHVQYQKKLLIQS